MVNALQLDLFGQYLAEKCSCNCLLEISVFFAETKMLS